MKAWILQNPAKPKNTPAANGKNELLLFDWLAKSNNPSMVNIVAVMEGQANRAPGKDVLQIALHRIQKKLSFSDNSFDVTLLLNRKINIPVTRHCAAARYLSVKS